MEREEFYPKGEIVADLYIVNRDMSVNTNFQFDYITVDYDTNIDGEDAIWMNFYVDPEKGRRFEDCSVMTILTEEDCVKLIEMLQKSLQDLRASK